MKGPGGRLRFDIRRSWECAVCHRRELTSGDVVSRLCVCSAKSDPPRKVWMKLIETKPARPAPPPPTSAPAEPTNPGTEPVAAPASPAAVPAGEATAPVDPRD